MAKIDQVYEVTPRLAKCFTDYRNNNLSEFSVEELLRQLIYANAMGYEDHNDHDELDKDPAIAPVGRNDPDGSDRKRKRDRVKPLTGKSTINRFITTAPDTDGKNRTIKSDLNFNRKRQSTDINHGRIFMV